MGRPAAQPGKDGRPLRPRTNHRPRLSTSLQSRQPASRSHCKLLRRTTPHCSRPPPSAPKPKLPRSQKPGSTLMKLYLASFHWFAETTPRRTWPRVLSRIGGSSMQHVATAPVPLPRRPDACPIHVAPGRPSTAPRPYRPAQSHVNCLRPSRRLDHNLGYSPQSSNELGSNSRHRPRIANNLFKINQIQAHPQDEFEQFVPSSNQVRTQFVPSSFGPLVVPRGGSPIVHYKKQAPAAARPALARRAAHLSAREPHGRTQAPTCPFNERPAQPRAHTSPCDITDISLPKALSIGTWPRQELS